MKKSGCSSTHTLEPNFASLIAHLNKYAFIRILGRDPRTHEITFYYGNSCIDFIMVIHVHIYYGNSFTQHNGLIGHALNHK